MSRILFYLQTSFCLVFSVQEYFYCSRVVNRLFLAVSELRHILNDTNIFIYLVRCIQTPGKLNWSTAHPSLSPNIDQFTNFVTILIVFQLQTYPLLDSGSEKKQRGTFGYNKRWATLQLSLPSVYTHHMRYIKDMCIIQEWPWYWYSTNKSVHHPRMSKFLLRFKTGKYIWL